MWCLHARTKSLQGIQKNCVTKFPSFSALELPSCELVVFIDVNMYIITEGGNSKMFLKENYAITLESCNLFTKNMFNMKLNMILLVRMIMDNETDFMNTLQFKRMINLTFC